MLSMKNVINNAVIAVNPSTVNAGITPIWITANTIEFINEIRNSDKNDISSWNASTTNVSRPNTAAAVTSARIKYAAKTAPFEMI